MVALLVVRDRREQALPKLGADVARAPALRLEVLDVETRIAGQDERLAVAEARERERLPIPPRPQKRVTVIAIILNELHPIVILPTPTRCTGHVCHTGVYGNGTGIVRSLVTVNFMMVLAPRDPWRS